MAVCSVRGFGVLPPAEDKEEKAMLHRMMRVDHAGEYGASQIYAGQMAVLSRTQTRTLIQVLVHMMTPKLLHVLQVKSCYNVLHFNIQQYQSIYLI